MIAFPSKKKAKPNKDLTSAFTARTRFDTSGKPVVEVMASWGGGMNVDAGVIHTRKGPTVSKKAVEQAAGQLQLRVSEHIFADMRLDKLLAYVQGQAAKNGNGTPGDALTVVQRALEAITAGQEPEIPEGT